jgi:NAD(P)-dependent dehydrogenase (short-subunit alcohol dehydrogenase family)
MNAASEQVGSRGPARPATMSGQTVLITGGTGGIGLSVARDLASRGGRVVITGRDQSRGAEAVSAIRAVAGHGDAEYIQADHSTVGGNQDLAQRLRGSVSRLHVLINNVGRVYAARTETPDGYEATLALCLVGPATTSLISAARTVQGA